MSEGDIGSWDELYGIEDDIEEVAKELCLTVIEKIKIETVNTEEMKEFETEMDLDNSRLKNECFAEYDCSE